MGFVDPPPGYRRRMVTYPINPDTLPDLIVWVAEGRLIPVGFMYEYDGNKDQPVPGIEFEELLSNDPDMNLKLVRCKGLEGGFWERE